MITPKVGDIVWFYNQYADPGFDGDEDTICSDEILVVDDSSLKCLTKSLQHIHTRHLWERREDIEEYEKSLFNVGVGDLVTFVSEIDEEGNETDPFIMVGTVIETTLNFVVVHTPGGLYEVDHTDCLVTNRV